MANFLCPILICIVVVLIPGLNGQASCTGHNGSCASRKCCSGKVCDNRNKCVICNTVGGYCNYDAGFACSVGSFCDANKCKKCSGAGNCSNMSCKPEQCAGHNGSCASVKCCSGKVCDHRNKCVMCNTIGGYCNYSAGFSCSVGNFCDSDKKCKKCSEAGNCSNMSCKLQQEDFGQCSPTGGRCWFRSQCCNPNDECRNSFCSTRCKCNCPGEENYFYNY